jgi:hypothetical protein
VFVLDTLVPALQAVVILSALLGWVYVEQCWVFDPR